MFAAFNRTQSAQFGGSGTGHVIACWLLPFLRTRDRAFKPLNERLQLNAATGRLQGSMDSEKARAQAGFPCSISTCWRKQRAGAFAFAGTQNYLQGGQVVVRR